MRYLRTSGTENREWYRETGCRGRRDCRGSATGARLQAQSGAMRGAGTERRRGCRTTGGARLLGPHGCWGRTAAGAATLLVYRGCRRSWQPGARGGGYLGPAPALLPVALPAHRVGGGRDGLRVTELPLIGHL